MARRLGWAALMLAACGTATPSPVRPAPSVPEPLPRTASIAPRAEAPLEAPALLHAAIRLPVDTERAIDDAVDAAIEAHQIPGAVVALGRRDGLVFLRAYGARATSPAREPNDVDTIYDLASITKVVATTTAVALLEERGALSYDDPVARHLPAFAANGKADVTIRQLLTHTSGLPAVDPLADYEGETRDASIARILALPLEQPPGTRAHYSDLGMIVLGEVVAQVVGEPLDVFVQREILGPLAMTSSCFRCDAALLGRIAPTERAERRGGVLIRGDVHDPRSFRLGGVAGNAGLFASAPDLARFARVMLGEGVLDGRRLLSAETVRTLVAQVPALGWQRRDESEQRAFERVHGTAMSVSSYGHSGFTGTWMRIDPANDAFAIVLSNDVHPDGRGDVRPLIQAVEHLVARDVDRWLAPPTHDVLSGIDVETRSGMAHLTGHRLVVVTHDAARARDGSRTLDVLASSATVLRVLAPEHGLASDHEGAVPSGRDARTSLPVLGLFGRTRRPTDVMLEGADTVVVDLVDVGVRFYTYASTMHEVLVAASSRPDLRVVILDRPSPLGGAIVEGPMLDPELLTFVSHHPLPLRHGMTMGELARMLDAELALGLGARFVVIGVEGWDRSDTALDVGARWTPPSPNLPDAETALLYPAVALVEGLDVSVGRGTDTPFHVLGAPWMDAEAVRESIGEVPGVSFATVRFTPRAGPHRGRPCRGLRVRLTDASLYRASRLGIAVVHALVHVHRDHADEARLLPLLGSRHVLEAITHDATPEHALALADEDAASFLSRRAPYLTPAP